MEGKGMKKNYKMIVCYDGSRYHGWERKKNQDTIQGKLEDVLTKMCQETVQVIGAGRTDAGVHAQAMTANVFLNTELKAAQIMNYMNRFLPDDIAIKEIHEASDRFHARYRAVGKWYQYTCYEGTSKPVFERKYVTVLNYHPDLEKMRQAAEYLKGRHDYKSFCGNSKMKKSTIREVDEIEIRRKNGFLYFRFHGNGFLQNMVRIMTGTLLEVGKGKIEPRQIQEILHACDRKMAGPTAPPAGLCLMKVDY